jgi:hypothetical protein
MYRLAFSMAFGAQAYKPYTHITPSAHKGQKKTSGPISGLGIRGTISCETDNMNP